MSISTIAALAILIFAAALLYSSVGHAGASGYLAAMALFGVAPDVMKPTALALNILVSSIATVKFYRADCFSWGVFWPFALASIPFAFIGGALALPTTIYKPVVGVILLYAAYHLFKVDQFVTGASIKRLPLWGALISGVVIGLLSGLTGVGGGIFLSPLLLLMGWAETRKTSGVSAAFILVNSVSALSGHLSSVVALPRPTLFWAMTALIGGWVGAEYGSRRLSGATLRRLLAAVLIIAGLKMIFT